ENKAEEKPFEPQQLLGKWNLTKATRDRVKTSRLDGAFFEFLDNNIFKTNILGTEEAGTYQVDDATKTITTETKKQLEYKVSKLDTGTLIVRLEINNANYRIWMEKERDEMTSDATSKTTSADPRVSN
ncbi:MAG: hypothetical protein AAF573_21090, partial [Bacteroidota bacterium]